MPPPLRRLRGGGLSLRFNRLQGRKGTQARRRVARAAALSGSDSTAESPAAEGDRRPSPAIGRRPAAAPVLRCPRGHRAADLRIHLQLSWSNSLAVPPLPYQ